MVVWLKPCKSRSLPGAYTETLQLSELEGFFFWGCEAATRTSRRSGASRTAGAGISYTNARRLPLCRLSLHGRRWRSVHRARFHAICRRDTGVGRGNARAGARCRGAGASLPRFRWLRAFPGSRLSGRARGSRLGRGGPCRARDRAVGPCCCRCAVEAGGARAAGTAALGEGQPRRASAFPGRRGAARRRRHEARGEQGRSR